MKAIGRAGVGLDNIDVETAEKRGIVVLNTSEAPADAVAELTIGLMISLARNIPLADRTMKEGKWIKKELTAWQLKGKNLGTIGLRNIGERVARIAKALGMRVLITKRTPLPPELQRELEAEYIPLKDFSNFPSKKRRDYHTRPINTPNASHDWRQGDPTYERRSLPHQHIKGRNSGRKSSLRSTSIRKVVRSRLRRLRR